MTKNGIERDLKQGAEKTAEMKLDGVKKNERLFKSGFYDVSDIDEAAQRAYDESLDDAELKRRRTRDWIFILIGVPVFIAFMYLIVMIFGSAR